MGILSNVLFSKVQQHILKLLYGHPDSDFYTNEIIRLANSGTGAVQRELSKLTSAGLLIVKQVGNQKRFQANRSSPLFPELRSIVLKTFGLAEIIQEAISTLEEHIQIAFIYGSIAKQEDTASSDIDLMIISDNLSYLELFPLLEKAETELSRTIHPTFHTPSEWSHKSHHRNNFITQLISQPKIYLIGTEDELLQLGKPGKDRPIKN